MTRPFFKDAKPLPVPIGKDLVTPVKTKVTRCLNNEFEDLNDLGLGLSDYLWTLSLELHLIPEVDGVDTFCICGVATPRGLHCYVISYDGEDSCVYKESVDDTGNPDKVFSIGIFKIKVFGTWCYISQYELRPTFPDNPVLSFWQKLYFRFFA